MPTSLAERTLFYFVTWWVWEQLCSYGKPMLAMLSDRQDCCLLLCLTHPHLEKSMSPVIADPAINNVVLGNFSTA